MPVSIARPDADRHDRGVHESQEVSEGNLIVNVCRCMVGNDKDVCS